MSRSVRQDTGVGTERAVGFARLLIAVAAAVIIVSTRSASSASELVVSLAIGAAIAGEAVALSWFLPRLGGDGPKPAWAIAAVQIVDTIWFVELTVVLADGFSGGSWVLLVLPVVIASLRVSSTMVFGVWGLASTGYLLSLWAGLIEIDGSSVDWSLALQQVGLLLMVAACIALLAQWLQEGWVSQAELTAEVDGRLGHVRAIELAARTMRNLEAADILKSGPGHVVSLGFAAGMVSKGKRIYGTAGSGGNVPAGVVIETPWPGTVEITRWVQAEGITMYSVSVLEESSNAVITGWDTTEVSDSMAEAMSDLVANITAALRAARYLAKVRYAATHDPLTGLANRAEIFRHLDLVATSNQTSAVLFLDLDHFKAVNDAHGHLVGDRLLILIARRLENAATDKATVGRYGGDEFVIVLSGPTASDTRALARSLLDTMKPPFEIDGQRIEASLSVGVAYSSTATDGNALLDAADSAAYGAKADGRNTARICRLDLADPINNDEALADR